MDWSRVQQLFDEASALPKEDAAGFLQKQCAGDPDLLRTVQELLDVAASSPSGFLRSLVESDAAEVAAQHTASSKDRTGQRIGQYQVEREIGRGGMGEVFLARRVDHEFEHRVALKIVRHGLALDEVLARFRRERQILARLEHPNIVRLLDGGSTPDGLPYLAMDYVEGLPITSYCDANDLDAKGRCRLMIQVCDAVSHAHRHLIVHRDLKPANIVVTQDGTPKLLDFGIAKLLDTDPDAGDGQQTVAGFRPLTPDYASPEQLSGAPITTGTDVYQLGTVLSELLTRQKPGSTPRVRLPADLDNIVRRAMHTDPQRRYESAQQLAEDLQRYLDNRPISARRDSLAYRAGKWIRRSPLAAAALALATLSIIAGVGATFYQARRAERRFEQVRALAGTFLFQFDDKIRDLQGAAAARGFVVETGLRYLDSLNSEASGDLSLQSELAAAYVNVGRIQGDPSISNLGKSSEALTSLERATQLSRLVLQQRPTDRRVLRTLAESLSLRGLILKAVRQQDAGLLALREAQLPADQILNSAPSLSADDLRLAAKVVKSYADMLALSSPKEAIPYYEKALTTLERGYQQTHDDAFLVASAAILIGTARIQRDLGNSIEWARRLEAAAAIVDPIHRMNPASENARRQLWVILLGLGDAYGTPRHFSLNQPEKAITFLRRAESLLSSSDPSDFGALSEKFFTQLAMAHALHRVDIPAGIARATAAIVLANEMGKRDSKNVATQVMRSSAEQELALLDLDAGQPASALPVIRRQLEFATHLLEDNASDLAGLDMMLQSHVFLGKGYMMQANWTLAEKHLRAAEQTGSEVVAKHPNDLYFIRNQAWTLEALGDYHRLRHQLAQGNSYYEQAIAMWNRWTATAVPGPFPQRHVSALQGKVAAPDSTPIRIVAYR